MIVPGIVGICLVLLSFKKKLRTNFVCVVCVCVCVCVCVQLELESFEV